MFDFKFFLKSEKIKSEDWKIVLDFLFFAVALYMGVWIEISMIFWVLMMVHVALYMGARINMVNMAG